MMGEFGRLLGITGEAAPIDSELAQKEGEGYRDKMFEQAKRIEERRWLTDRLAEMKKEIKALKDVIKKLSEELNAEKEK